MKLEFSTQVRVRYVDCDQSGFVYNGNYATFYEVGRAESFRQLGHTYKQMEDDGIVMPLINQYSRFYKPAFYDNVLTIITRIPEIPKARIRFEYSIYNEENELINEGYNELIFLSKEKGRPMRAPEWFIALLTNSLSS
ncbi:acyl-CoA thioesterase [Lentimicrobium sp. L6]|uniref:acyl-CoA thioesterase n=1 Tax=Lentimicrobium sp. L6 TaxID=2735916 RepID=UPI0015548818|nr:thioesterase family protein [Lentimicrobium sp. L6]NPD83494.1 acyl-CoA thioesterase [Lentimicrobium sp. L6]